MENGHAPRQRRTLRRIISDLIRNGHVEVWEVTDRELSEATRPPQIITERQGEQLRNSKDRTFLGFKVTWKF
jgi:hypothetical protein